MTMGGLDAGTTACAVLGELGATLREALVAAFSAALGVTAGSAAPAVCAPNSVGFHQTTRNATARPITTALIKKLTKTRVFCK